MAPESPTTAEMQKPYVGKAPCPNPICQGGDNSYMQDDCTPHECDWCGTRWKTYDPEGRIEGCLAVVIPSLRSNP